MGQWMDVQKKGEMDGQTDKWTEGWLGGQIRWWVGRWWTEMAGWWRADEWVQSGSKSTGAAPLPGSQTRPCLGA